jgi:hypothetical protein
MTDPQIHEMLAEPLEERVGMPLTSVERELLQAITVGGAMLPLYADRYRELAARRREEGGSDELRADALDAAGTLAAVLGVARKYQPHIVVLDETELKSGKLFTTLEQIYDSLLLLTDPEFDEETDVSLTDDDVDVFLSLPDVQEYVNPQL